MRQFTLLILFTFLILTSSGQDKKDLAVSFSTGILNQTERPHNQKQQNRKPGFGMMVAGLLLYFLKSARGENK